MKTKIVLWATDETDKKILLGIELKEAENKIHIHTFPEEVATEIFYNQMMNLWREGQSIPFPDGHAIIERTLSMTESILPDNIRTTRQDILTRAKTEWHFVVLSAKLYATYADEIQDFKDRIRDLSSFDGALWEELKAFWSKVQGQVREKNLFKEHAIELRNKTNELFDDLKSLRTAMNEEFERRSKEHLDRFFEILNGIEERISKGLGLQPIFNELKELQNRFRDTELTRRHRRDIWKKLDGAFKLVKEKKYGKGQSGGSALARISRRYEGLQAAIQKMEGSIKRDRKEQDFQKKRINDTDGQLELQIRQAKLAMIEERILSKESKLTEMRKTLDDLNFKIEKERRKEEKLKEKSEIKKAKENLKGDVAKEMEEAAAKREQDDDKLLKAAASINEGQIAQQNENESQSSEEE